MTLLEATVVVVVDTVVVVVVNIVVEAWLVVTDHIISSCGQKYCSDAPKGC